MNCSQCWLSIGAIVAGLAVAAGAFGAHGLGGKTGYLAKKYGDTEYETAGGKIPAAQKYLADFKTGAEYQMYHGLALLAVGFIAQSKPSKWLTTAGCTFLAGCLCFSGGLYVYSIAGIKWVGMAVVPLGGTLFLVGWFCLAVAAGRKNLRIEDRGSEKF